MIWIEKKNLKKLYKKLVDENASELEKQKENAFKKRKRNVKMVIAFLVIFIICSGIIIKTLYDEASFERHNVYKSTELITETINENCKMNMAEVYTRYDKEIGSKDDITKTSFYGIFSKIETPKTFNTELYIRKDNYSY